MRHRFLVPLSFLMLLGAAAVGPAWTGRGPVEQPVSVQMHLHGSFSEGWGSIASHTEESRRAGLDALWWSDHDWRILAYRHCSRFSFDAWAERIDRLEDWSANTASDARTTKGVKLARAGILELQSAEIDPQRAVEGSGSLRLEARSAHASFQDFEHVLYANRSRFLRPLSSWVTLDIALLPEDSGPDAQAYLEVRLSFHPDPSIPNRRRYRIRYEFTPQGGAPYRTGEVYHVPVAVTPGAWNHLSLPITADAEVAFAPFDGEDNALHDVFLGVSSRSGATATANFDALHIRTVIPPAERYGVEASMLAAKELEVPEVAQLLGTEISFVGEHLNEFSVGTELPDYEALFQGSGLLSAGGFVADPIALADFVSRRVVQDAHARGGLVSYNHAFGTSTVPTATTPLKEQALGKLRANDLYGADILEVGYRLRGRPLVDHLWVWDQLGLGGRFVVGTGVSDSHSGFTGEYDGTDNTFVSWIWAASMAAADLLEGLRRGRVFFGDIARFDGALDLVTDGGARMGDILVTHRSSQTVTARLEGLVNGDQVSWIVSGAPQATVLAAGPTLQDTQVVVLDPTRPTLVRLELHSSAGQPKAFSNPLTFVRSTPDHAQARVVYEGHLHPR